MATISRSTRRSALNRIGSQGVWLIFCIVSFGLYAAVSTNTNLMDHKLRPYKIFRGGQAIFKKATRSKIEAESKIRTCSNYLVLVAINRIFTDLQLPFRAIQGMIWSAISFSLVRSRWYYMCLRILDRPGLAFLAEFNFPESTAADRRCIELLRFGRDCTLADGKKVTVVSGFWSRDDVSRIRFLR